MPMVEEGGVEDFGELMEKLKEHLPHVPRPCWIPDYKNRKQFSFENTKQNRKRMKKIEENEVEDGDTRLMSKFGGVEPWLDSEVGWPKCLKCKNAKSFICQLLIKDLPKYLKDMLGKTDGMFQCFACLKCMSFGDEGLYDDAFVVDESKLRAPGSLKFVAASVAIKHEAELREEIKTIPKVLEDYVDKLDPQEPESESDLDESSSDEDQDDEPSAKKSKLSSDRRKPKKRVKQFPEKVVTGWIWEQDELPNPYEMPDYESEILGAIDLNTYFFENTLYDWEGIYEDEYCYMAVKIGGYFPWIQGHNAGAGMIYPTCKNCKVVMNQSFMMLRECDILKYEWGEDGMGFVSVCPKCKRPELNWASI